MTSTEDDVHHSDHADTTDSTDHAEDSASTDHADSATLADQTAGIETADAGHEETANTPAQTEDTAPTDQTVDHASSGDSDATTQPEGTNAADHAEGTEQADNTETANTVDETAQTDESNANHLIDHDNLDLSGVNQDTSSPQASSESPEASLNLLLGDIDSHLNEGDTQGDDGAADKAVATETGDDNQATVIDLSEIIHDDGSQDLSSLIQVADTSEGDQTPGHVQDVPAESSGSDSGDAWSTHDAAELDHLIAQPDTDS